jgi:hypothetical protein
MSIGRGPRRSWLKRDDASALGACTTASRLVEKKMKRRQRQPFFQFTEDDLIEFEHLHSVFRKLRRVGPNPPLHRIRKLIKYFTTLPHSPPEKATVCESWKCFTCAIANLLDEAIDLKDLPAIVCLSIDFGYMFCSGFKLKDGPDVDLAKKVRSGGKKGEQIRHGDPQARAAQDREMQEALDAHLRRDKSLSHRDACVRVGLEFGLSGEMVRKRTTNPRARSPKTVG